jgi:hypothetical protein
VHVQAQWLYHVLELRLYVSHRRGTIALMHLRTFGD